MSTALHVGKKRVNTVLGSDGTAIPAGALTVTAPQPQVATATVDAQNNVTVTGVSAGSANVVYAAPGFGSVTESYVVSPPPTIIVTDGPEQ